MMSVLVHYLLRHPLGPAPELLAYSRSDIAGLRDGGSESMNHYLHVHYEDIEEPYRERVFKLGV